MVYVVRLKRSVDMDMVVEAEDEEDAGLEAMRIILDSRVLAYFVSEGKAEWQVIKAYAR